MTSPQKVFESTIKKIEKMYGLTSQSMCRYYHDEESVSVDGELHSMLNHMSSFGATAVQMIEDALSAKGYFMENQNGCDFKFYRI